MLPALAARLAGYASRDWCEPFVPTVARSYLGARVAILAQRLCQSGSLAFWRCGFADLLVSVQLHLNGSETRPAICLLA